MTKALLQQGRAVPALRSRRGDRQGFIATSTGLLLLHRARHMSAALSAASSQKSVKKQEVSLDCSKSFTVGTHELYAARPAHSLRSEQS